MNVPNLPKVSVCMITYNHERYIAQAIARVLMQQTNFEYELVIGEDCSPDGTRAIVDDFQRRYPDRIRVLQRDTNLGIQRNFADTLNACRGQYIALLEGDDYWTSEHKLQKQVNILDMHPEYSACFHAVLRTYEDVRQEPQLVTYNRAVLTIEDLLQHNPVQTCSVMFRSGLFGEFPPWFFLRLRIVGDWILHALNAQHGDFYYLDEAMGTYRVHSSGVWLSIDEVQRCYERIAVLTCLNEEFQFRYAHIVHPTVSKQYMGLMRLYEQREEYKLALLAGLTAWRWWPANPSMSKLRLAMLVLYQVMPSVVVHTLHTRHRQLRI